MPPAPRAFLFFPGEGGERNQQGGLFLCADRQRLFSIRMVYLLFLNNPAVFVHDVEDNQSDER